MLDEEKKTLSQVRLEKAKENLAAANTLLASVEKAEEFVKVISEYLNSIY